MSLVPIAQLPSWQARLSSVLPGEGMAGHSSGKRTSSPVPRFPALGLEASSFLSRPAEMHSAEHTRTGTPSPTPWGPPSLLASTVVHFISKDCLSRVWPGLVLCGSHSQEAREAVETENVGAQSK